MLGRGHLPEPCTPPPNPTPSTHKANEVGASGIPQQVGGEALQGNGGGPSGGDDHILGERQQVRGQQSQLCPPGLSPGVTTLLKLPWPQTRSCPGVSTCSPGPSPPPPQLLRPGCLSVCTWPLAGSQVHRAQGSHVATLGPEP